MLATTLFLTALYTPSPIPQQAAPRIPNGPVTVQANAFGVLMQVPATGLRTLDGPIVELRGKVQEWYGISFKTQPAMQATGNELQRWQAVGLGQSSDWQQRPSVEALSFRQVDERLIAVNRFRDLQITTVLSWDPEGPYLLGLVTLENQGNTALHELYYSREWRLPGDLGFSFPDDSLTEDVVPGDLCRVIWMPGDLQPGGSTGLRFSYTLPGVDEAQGSGEVDVPLTLFVNQDFPSGFNVGSTNGVSWGDYDADGWIDFFAARSRRLWRSIEGRTFELFTITSEIPGGIRYGSAFGDYNNDGLLDLGTEPRAAGDTFMHLLKNLGDSQFEDVADDPAIVDQQPFGDSETLCWADVDHDSHMDAFLPVYPPRLSGPGNFFLYNLGPTGPGGVYRFQELSGPAGLNNPQGAARPEGAEYVDLDFDGDLDLYCNGTYYKNRSTPGNPLFRNQNEAGTGILYSTLLEEGLSFFDYDMDGDYDLLIAYCSIGVKVFEARGDGSYFEGGAGIIQNPNIGLCLGLSKGDWDNDGDIDLTTRQVFRRNMFMETGNRRFIVASHDIPSGHRTSATPAWGDFDRDGDLDCLLGNWTSTGHLYENTVYDETTAEDQRRYVRVRVMRDHPELPAGTENEYGASVDVHVHGEDDRIRRKQFVTSAAGYLNQNEYTLHFAMPADPDPHPGVDLRFDLSIDFNSLPEEGLRRIDRHVNPALGNLHLADLHDREIVVFRSGRVLKNGCNFEVPASTALLTHTSQRLPQLTRAVPLPDPTDAPGTDWYAGVEFDTHGVERSILVKEIIVEGRLDPSAGDCQGTPHNLLLWDVTDSVATLVPGGTLTGRAFRRNHRSFYRASLTLPTGRVYRLVARMAGLRPIAVADEGHASGGLRVRGGLSFTDLDPCSGNGVMQATVDADQTYLAFRYALRPANHWTELGHGLIGSQGVPRLEGSGDLQAGNTITLSLSKAAPHVPTLLFAGADLLCEPFAGGILVPSPDLRFANLVTDAEGRWSVAGEIPADLPAGSSTFFQVWLPDSEATGGLSASNGLGATLP